jgi:hypothetical protein
MPTCADQTDCTAKWGRALHWVLEHNPAIIESTDTLIRTAPAEVAGPNYLQVTRIPETGGGATLDLRVGCASLLIGCDWKRLKRDFVEAVGQ